MKNNLIKIYALAVCFVCISCIAITSGFALYQGIVYVWPEWGIDSHMYASYQSSDSFKNSPYLYSSPRMVNRRALYEMNQSGVAIPAQIMPKEPETRKPMGDEEIEELRKVQYANLLDQTKFDATQSLLRYFVILVVSAPLFFIHWRIAKRE
jgi:hypothetical protein